MAVNTPVFTIAAAVAAIGAFCRFESHRLPSTSDTDGHHDQSYSRQGGELNGKAKKERATVGFAPEFDGLHCYETLVRF